MGFNYWKDNIFLMQCTLRSSMIIRLIKEMRSQKFLYVCYTKLLENHDTFYRLKIIIQEKRRARMNPL